MNLLASFIGFLGLLIGKVISSNTREEVKEGANYLLILQNFFIAAIILSLFLYKINLIVIFGLLIGILIGLYFQTVYFYLGIASMASFLVSNEFGLWINAIIFLFGLIYGSLRKFQLDFMEFISNVGIPNFILFFIPFLLLIMEGKIINNLEIFLGISAGGLAARFFRRA